MRNWLRFLSFVNFLNRKSVKCHFSQSLVIGLAFTLSLLVLRISIHFRDSRCLHCLSHIISTLSIHLPNLNFFLVVVGLGSDDVWCSYHWGGRSLDLDWWCLLVCLNQVLSNRGRIRGRSSLDRLVRSIEKLSIVSRWHPTETGSRGLEWSRRWWSECHLPLRW